MNGTVVFANASDEHLVFSNPVKPGLLVDKWNTHDLKISLTSTISAQYVNHTELPGYLKVTADLKGNASIYVNTSLTPILVKVNNAPYSFSYVNRIVVLTGLSSIVEVYYSTPVTAITMPGAAPVGAIYEVGFADNAVLENSTLRIGILVNGSIVTPVLYYNGNISRGREISGLSYPLAASINWGCDGGVMRVSYMLTYVLGGYTHSAVSRHVFTDVSVNCPLRLYPYITVHGDVTGAIDKYGGVVSEILEYMGVGTFKITVQGPLSSSGIVKYLVLNNPVKLRYTYSGVEILPGERTSLTLTGFRGFTLSYSVAGVTVSNVLIGIDEYSLEFPYGVALMVIVDPSSKTISIVQVAAPAQPVLLTTTTAPWIYVPTPPTPAQPIFPYDWGAPQFIILYGAVVAVAILASKLTGSVLRGIMLSSLSFGLVLFAIGVYTGSTSILGVSLFSFILSAGAEIARRHAS